MTPLTALRAAVRAAAGDVRDDPADAEVAGRAALDRPKRADFGHYSTNAAMLLAPSLGTPPREVAARLGAALEGRLGASVERVDVAGPGFLNLFLADPWFVDAAAAVLDAGTGWGTGDPATSERVLVEFVSSNPTGPVHVGHARNAAYGDALARLLAFRGDSVAREFYVNDAGTQVTSFAASIAARARGEDPPDDGYRGEYVAELAAAIPGAAALDLDAVAAAGLERMLDHARETLGRFRVQIDSWFSEASLHAGSPSPVERAFAVLAQQGRTYRSEGALWLRTTEFGDDKDRVLERSSGDHTYFASDIAYHQEKRERGFDRLIDVLGADHHGYVRRMLAAWEALGGDPARLELLTMQFVHLVEGGERASMSKRAGEFVTLDDLLDEIGVDAARWYLLQRSHDTTIDIDLALARSETSENPVYYVQYAHARIASILREGSPSEFAPPAGPLHASERALVLELLAWPGEAQEAAERRAPHRVATYALSLAQSFTAFYRDCKVLGSESEAFRLGLCRASAGVIATALDLLGIEAPERM